MGIALRANGSGGPVDWVGARQSLDGSKAAWAEAQRTLLATMELDGEGKPQVAPVGRPLWKDVPSWFLVAEEDRMIVPEMQRVMAARMQATVCSHAVDHTPLVTAPALVTAIVREAISAVAGQTRS